MIYIRTNGGEVQATVNLTITDVIHKDDFSDPSTGWVVASSDAGEAKYEDGRYHLLTRRPDDIIVGKNPAIGQLGDFLLEVDVRSLSTARDASYGVTFRQKDIDRSDNFYYFQVSSRSGRYRIERLSNGVWTTLRDWTDSNQIKNAPAVNRLKVVCEGAQIELYVNGASLATIADDSFREGFVGLAAGPGLEAGSTVDVVFDNIAIYFPD